MEARKLSQWLTQKTKSNSATHFCKVCFRAMRSPSISDCLSNYSVCQKCINEMNPDWRSETIHGYKANYLYTYGGKIKEMIYLCKGCGDIEIAELFLQKQAKLIKLLNFGRLIVPAPSSKEKDEERGFNHVEKMFSEIGLPMVRALKKIDQVKQSDLNYEKRKEIKNHIRLVEGTNIKGKRILLVDDIITSGFTMKTCADLLMKNGAKSVKILAIARTLNA